MQGHELARMREAAGLTLRELASLIGRSYSHLSKVESGRREITDALIRAYRDACNGGTVEDVNRRQFMATSAIAAGGVPLLRLSDLPLMVGGTEVQAVRKLALGLNMNDRWTLSVGRAALRRAVGLMDRRVSTALGPPLRAAVALLADRVGWAEHELGEDPRQALHMAITLGHQADDPDIQAHAYIDLAVATPDVTRALAILDKALEIPVLTPAERINVLAVAARRAKPLGLRAGLRYLNQAMAIAPEFSTVDWAQAVTSAPGHLHAMMGFAGHALGHAEAPEWLRTAVAELPEDRRRTRARAHARLAAVALGQGDAEAALRHVRHSRTAPQSTMVRRDLGVFARQAEVLGYPDLAELAAPRDR